MNDVTNTRGVYVCLLPSSVILRMQCPLTRTQLSLKSLMLTSATFPVKAAVSAKLGTVTPFTPTYQPCPKEGTVRLVVRSVHLPLCGRLCYLCFHAIPFPQVLYGPRLTPNEQITAEMMGCHFRAWVTGCGFPLGHPFCLSHLPTLL